jgi:hypothetical protein
MPKITDWCSEPFINTVDSVSYTMSDELMFVHRVSGNEGGARKFLTSRLGKQHYIVVFPGQKTLIWERLSSGPRWRVYASKRGLAFEFELNLSPSQIIDAWEDFKKAISRYHINVNLSK